MHNQEFIKEEYSKLTDKYETFGTTLKLNLEALLNKENIGYLSVTYRVKEVDSLLGKIERKTYLDVFKEVEDFCGVRIICYYTTDLKKIDDIIEKNFKVESKCYKESELKDDQFGYLSNHYIVKLKESWCEVPINECCKGLKAEIQVRTILMHAWADISHKLDYKTENDSPKKLRRKLNQLSALFEMADGHFVELKDMKEKYRHESKIEIEKNESDVKLELNMDSLQILLDNYFSDYPAAKSKALQSTLEIIKSNNITINTLSNLFNNIDKEELKIIGDEIGIEFNQNGVLRVILDLNYTEIFNLGEEENRDSRWLETIEKHKKNNK